MINFNGDIHEDKKDGKKIVGILIQKEISLNEAFEIQKVQLAERIKSAEDIKNLVDLMDSEDLYDFYSVIESKVDADADEYNKENKVEVTDEEKLMRIRIIIIQVVKESGRKDIIQNSIGHINRLSSGIREDIKESGNTSGWSIETMNMLTKIMK